MEFIKKTNKQIVTRVFEVENNEYRYEINVSDSCIEMNIYPKRKVELEDGSIIEEKYLYPTGSIILKNGKRRMLIEGDIDKHIAVFDEFLNTLQ